MVQVLANTDSYKLTHRGFMNEGTEYIYSNATARNFKHLPVNHKTFDGKMVVFGIQYLLINYLTEEWNTDFFGKDKESVIAKFHRRVTTYYGEDIVPMEHFEELWELGYLPIRIKALPEGALVGAKVPFFTITNTNPKFAWLTNYLETAISCEIWKPCTTATLIRQYRLLCDKYAIETTGSTNGTEFQCHDFSFRGMSGRQDAAINSAGFLLSSSGTDSLPAIDILQDYYQADATKEFIGTSVPASEHSLACLGYAVDGELESFRKWITKDYPSGIVSLVSDTTDHWKVLTEYIPALRGDIMARTPNGLGLCKTMVRPDSGDPVDIICGTADVFTVSTGEVDLEGLGYYLEDYLIDKACEGVPQGECGDEHVEMYVRYDGLTYKVVGTAEWDRHDRQYYYLDGVVDIKVVENKLSPEEKGSIELLWETFGGTITDEGYKVLDPHIGLIYGDSITLARAEDIFSRLKAKGFASTNVVFGIGSYTMQYLTRDSVGMAIKATWAQVDGVAIELAKNPVTDDGTKKSAKGLLYVGLDENGDYCLEDCVTPEREKEGELKVVFEDGWLHNQITLSDIRNRLWG